MCSYTCTWTMYVRVCRPDCTPVRSSQSRRSACCQRTYFDLSFGIACSRKRLLVHAGCIMQLTTSTLQLQDQLQKTFHCQLSGANSMSGFAYYLVTLLLLAMHELGYTLVVPLNDLKLQLGCTGFMRHAGNTRCKRSRLAGRPQLPAHRAKL